jgi:hypothetical protein
MPLQISTLKFWINLEPLDYFRLIGMARGGRSRGKSVLCSFAPNVQEKSARRRFFLEASEAHFFLATTRTISRHCLA